MPLDCTAILARYFSGTALEMIITHGIMVSHLATSISRSIGMTAEETVFVSEAAMLHDIGICRVNAPGIGMTGPHPYLMHGVLGREILEKEGYPRHALICERHIGVGLTGEDIAASRLPLPLRDMRPVDLAEEIICFADLFYSKTPGRLEKRKSVESVRNKLEPFGADKVEIFERWLIRFGCGLSDL